MVPSLGVENENVGQIKDTLGTVDSPFFLTTGSIYDLMILISVFQFSNPSKKQEKQEFLDGDLRGRLPMKNTYEPILG